MKAGFSIMSLSPISVFACAVVMLSPTAWAQNTRVLPTNVGYVFVDGQYVPPPYDVRRENDHISINGREFTADYFGGDSDERSRIDRKGGFVGRLEGSHNGGRDERMRGGRGGDWGDGKRGGGIRYEGGRGGRGGDGRGEGRGGSLLGKIYSELELVPYGAVVVMYEDSRPAVLYASNGGYKLLSFLAGNVDGEFAPSAGASAEIIGSAKRLIAEFQPTSAFVRRVETDLETLDGLTTAGERSTAANQLVSRISYPLTVFAMVIVVLGFGHLLSTRPVSDDVDDSLGNRAVIVKSLSLIAILSAIDLVWTIAASHAGTMRELNPLGSRLIQDPSALILFKLMVTGTSIGILYALHRRPVARTAAWWCCLLLTLLTARWVVFQSMFV